MEEALCNHACAHQGCRVVGGTLRGIPCTSWPVPSNYDLGGLKSAPEPCSVPWPDSFNVVEANWQCQLVMPGKRLEAEVPLEGEVTPMPSLFDVDLLLDDDCAQQMWAAGNDGMEEDKPPAKRRLNNLPGLVTTLIVRNVPYACTQADLQVEWPIQQFAYDYLHLPLDTRSRPLGYAYLNFVLPIHASTFHLRWHGRFLTKHHFSKSLSVTEAHRQGKHANLACVKGNNLKLGVPALFRGAIKLSNEEVLQVIEACKRSTAKLPFTETHFQ